MGAVSSWMSRSVRKDASSSSVSSGGASLTSMPGRLRWIEVATASRYILGETVTRTRTSFSYLERQVSCVVPARHLGQPLLTSENPVWARFAEYPFHALGRVN